MWCRCKGISSEIFKHVLRGILLSCLESCKESEILVQPCCIP
ncbi:hypothetical protein DOY81_005015, partial [Sarcophaga bullata]